MAAHVSPESDPLADALRSEKVRAVCKNLQTTLARCGDVSDGTLLSAADQLRQLGLSEGDAAEALATALPEGLDPRIERMLDIAFGMSGLCDAPPLGPAWLLPLILARRHAGLLVGLSGAGKSMLFAILAVIAASGGAFFGRQFIAPIGVLILSGEAADEVMPRLRGIAAALGLNPDALPVVCAACRDSRDIPLQVEAAQMRLRREFRCRLDLILLDNLRTIHKPPDEEDQAFAEATMRSLREIAERYDACVVLAHHTGKRDSAPRGAQAWVDTSNFVLQIDAEQDRRTGLFRKRRLRLVKTRHGPPLDLGEFWIEDGPAGGVPRFGEAPQSTFSSAQARTDKARPSQRVASSTERILAAQRAAQEAGHAVEVNGRLGVSVDAIAPFFLGDRPPPSRARNLRRDVLAAARQAGVGIFDHGGATYLEIPGAP